MGAEEYLDFSKIEKNHFEQESKTALRVRSR